VPLERIAGRMLELAAQGGGQAADREVARA
jgi:hypothetical protein